MGDAAADGPIPGYTYNDNNVLVPEGGVEPPKKVKVAEDSSSDDDSDGDVNVPAYHESPEVRAAMSAASEHKAAVAQLRKSNNIPDQKEVMKDSVSDWHFDLGDVEDQLKKIEEETRARHDMLSKSQHSYEDALSKLSSLDDELEVFSVEMDEVNIEIKNIQIATEEQKAKREEIATKQEKRRKTSAAMEKRKAQREARMKRARDRIAKEKADAELKERREAREAAAKEKSPEARMARAYDWYMKCGMLNKDELKKKVRTMPPGSKLVESDIDLLPWNKLGTIVSLQELEARGVKTH